MRAAVLGVALALAGCDKPKVVFENSTTVPEYVNGTGEPDANR